MNDLKNLTSKSNAPLFGLQKFRNEQIAGRHEILFNELKGEKIIDKPHAHDFFMINLFETSSGTHNIDAIDYPVGNKEVHILFPEQTHKWHLDSNTIGYQLMMKQDFLEQFAPYFRYSFTNYQNNPVIQLNKDAFEKLKYEFTAIKEELETEKSLLNLLQARAAVIAAIVSTQAELAFTEFKIYQTNDKLANFNMLIDAYYKKDKTVSFYAEQLNITANYLNILCKKHLKVKAIQLIHQRVLTEAKRLLQNKKLSIKEITYNLGFSDFSHFSRFFKNQAGVTPSEFRNLLT